MFGLFRKPPPPLSTPPEDSWAVAQAELDGKPMFLRINEGLRPWVGRSPFGHRFGVTVPLRAPNEHGLPTDEEASALEQIEEALLAAFPPGGPSLLAVVITTGGFREWVFYTSAADEVGPALEALRPRAAPHEVQFYVEPDRKWAVFRSFLP